ncbi:DNA polymerase I [Vagococcus intermedius]|uniref:DNA polymerase I n=1 Tax=Vagococcus intermedius TaxID=2991418 RepID=A0AAF0CTJ3_9ENTE|nr:DNA polymerase I [Vagococcus intermedius]WEG72700.1 DNA polymerase I [Vagococcus intermedius]WEG74785.1 DNA polymerase I [Vagococcus intermedius]
MPKNKLLLIDGNSIAFRAFYAVQNFESFKTKTGLHTNAVLFFNNMLESIMEKEKPSHVLIAFDAGKTTFRHAFFDEYKAGRAKTPGEFKEQMPYIRELIEACGIKHYELADYEADDIIGTLAKRVDPTEYDVVVLSGDKDLTQLASETIRVEVTSRGVSELVTYTPAFIKEKYGLEPMQIVDMKGLAGDSSDNIPGVTRVGEKTALKLLHEYGSVENLYEHIDDLKQSKMKENLINDREQAFLSKKLATIDTNAPIEIVVDSLLYEGKELEKLVPFYREMEFKQLLNKLDTSQLDEAGESLSDIQFEHVLDSADVTPEMFTDEMSFYIEILDKNYHTAEVQGVSWGSCDSLYVSQGDSVLHSPLMQEWLEDKTRHKNVYDAKANLVLLHRYGIKLTGISFDSLLAAYLIDTNDKSEDLAEVAFNHDYYELERDEAIYGKGAKIAIPEESIFFGHLARKVKALETIKPTLVKKLADKEQSELFYEMELPLSHVLAEMESTGIAVNAQRLQEMKQEFAVQLQAIETRIYEQAGEEFNINSPKQLGVILFEKMGLPVIKKTKTGYSTAVDVLEQLKEQAPIIEDILHYRQIMKIQSTYVEGLLKVIHPNDGKIHTRYVQTLTQTGRLSSVDPNLQNIPVRLEEGRKIRQAFVPSHPDWQIFSSDYSQIELRVLADIAQDEHMREAFREDQDIHASTAMRVFGVAETSEVTPNIRRQAKAVNFGIVYGISDYGLSQNLGISRVEAQEFIDKYFEKYPAIKTYMEEVVREAKDKGYVETLWHRRRYLPDINARNFNLRTFAERTAINTPIQGSAADILKIAMIQMAKRLKAEKLEATMLLQVHDELVFEAPESEIPRLEKLVKEVMEQAVELSVPLKVDSSVGDTWYEAK